MLVKQLIYYIIGFLLLINFKDIKKIIPYLYIIFNIILLYLLIFGTSINGSKAWINTPIFSFQPSEFMKIILIIYISMLSTNKKYKLKTFIITLIPAILTFLEPDTGNVIFYFIIYFSLLIYKEKNIKKLIKPFILLSLFLIIFIISYLNYKHAFINIFGYSIYYRVERILSLFTKESYQLSRALIGMGNAYLFGSDDIVSIPFSHTDFAFSYLVSNLGYLKTLIFLLFNMSFDFYLIKSLRNYIGVNKIILFIFILMKIFQETIHTLMNIGLFPITGITYPFISYGGSSLLAYFLMLSYLSNNRDNLDME